MRKKPVDPSHLLEKGDVCGALVAALDLKNTDVLLNLLKKITQPLLLRSARNLLYCAPRNN